MRNRYYVITLFFQPTVTLTPETTIGDALKVMKTIGASVAPIVGECGSLVGQFNQSKCMEKILSGECSTQTAVSKCSDSTVKHVTSETSIGKAARIVQNNDYVFVVDNGTYKRTIYHFDILDFIQKE